MNYLILGMSGYVIAINKEDGNEVWRTKLKSSSITVVSSDHNRVYAASSGHLFCLDKATGEQVWTNPLKGLGYGTCIIDVGSQNASFANSAVSGTVAETAAVTAATATAIAVSGSASAGDGG